MSRMKQSVYVSVMMSEAEKAHMDECAEAAGKTRNRWLRDLIARQPVKK